MVTNLTKAVLLLVCLAPAVMPAGGQEREREHRKFKLVIGHGGLVLLAATQEGFALATDGSSFNADGTTSLAEKLLPAGKQGAVAFAGTVAIQDPVGRAVRQEVNVSRLAAAWLKAHPEADIDTVGQELNAQIESALNKFYATRDPEHDAGKYKFEMIVVGFAKGKPSAMVTRYFIPKAKGAPVRTEKTTISAKPGEVLAFGPAKVKDELLTGKSGALKAFKDEAPVEKFRAAAPGAFGLQDYVGLFDVILRASESEEGKKFDGSSAIVAKPNSFAVVTQQGGFEWKRE